MTHGYTMPQPAAAKLPLVLAAAAWACACTHGHGLRLLSSCCASCLADNERSKCFTVLDVEVGDYPGDWRQLMPPCSGTSAQQQPH